MTSRSMTLLPSLPVLGLLLTTALLAAGDAAPDLGPVDAPFRLDVAFARHEGVGERVWLDVQVIHHQLVIIGNDYTQEVRKAAYAAKKAELDAIMAKPVNAWTQLREYEAVFEPAFIAAYTQPERLDQPAFFTITSTEDPAYAAAANAHPAKVSRWAMPRGNYREFQKTRGRESTAGVNLANFSYLFLPTPMRRGCAYRFAQADGRAATIVFHEDHTVSRALKVNQSGYSPLAKRKYAYLGAWQPGVGPVPFADWDGKPFEVVDADSRKVVHSGTITLLAKDPKTWIGKFERSAAGEDLYQLDLSGLTAQGDCYIRVAGLGRSWPFNHGGEAAGKAFYLHLRGLFHQRGGHELAAAWTGWPRPFAHGTAYVGDYVCEHPGIRTPVSDFEAIEHGRKTRPDVEWGPPGKGGVGGWYDAADYDRRRWHYDTIYDLLIAYAIAPAKFRDGQEHTYESTNGIPDILDEVAWGLLVWRNSQDEKGGIAGHLEARKHPNSSGDMPSGRPHHDPEKYYFSARCRESSLVYAGAAAHLARVLKPFKPEVAAGWLDSARRAYAFGANPANHYERKDYAGSGKPCREGDEMILVSWCLAGLELYRATQERAFLDQAIELHPKMKPHLRWPIKFVYHDFFWAFYDDAALPKAIRDAARADCLRQADELERFTLDATFYRSCIDPRWAWGTAWGKASATYDARGLAMAYALTHQQKYLDAIALCVDWVQGCNPLGTSWTSGIGYTYPWCFFSGESEEDGILDPVPGITVYGVVGGLPIGARTRGFNLASRDPRTGAYTMAKRLLPESVKLNPQDFMPPIPYWRMWVMDYHDAPDLQEYTVNETISPCVLAWSVLLPDGWMPSARLKAMKPRDERHVIGQWPTP